jgi:hypothetical protein
MTTAFLHPTPFGCGGASRDGNIGESEVTPALNGWLRRVTRVAERAASGHRPVSPSSIGLLLLASTRKVVWVGAHCIAHQQARDHATCT